MSTTLEQQITVQAEFPRPSQATIAKYERWRQQRIALGQNPEPYFVPTTETAGARNGHTEIMAEVVTSDDLTLELNVAKEIQRSNDKTVHEHIKPLELTGTGSLGSNDQLNTNGYIPLWDRDPSDLDSRDLKQLEAIRREFETIMSNPPLHSVIEK